MTTLVQKIIPAILILIAVIAIIFAGELASETLPVAEKYFSPDQQLSSGEDGVKLVILTMLGLLILLNVLVLFRVDLFIPDFFKSFLNNDAVRGYFFKPDFASNPSMTIPKNVFVIAVIMSLVSSFFWIFRENPIFTDLYEEDNFFEYFSVLLFLAAAFLLARTGMMFTGLQQKFQLPLVFKWGLYVLVAGLVFIALEEISWGQRILGFESPEELESINYQGEINLHNIFNPFYELLYPVVGISFFLFLFTGWIPSRETQPLLFRMLFPHPSLFPFAMVLLTSSIPGESELFEVILSYFIFFYALRLFVFARYLQTTEVADWQKQAQNFPV